MDIAIIPEEAHENVRHLFSIPSRSGYIDLCACDIVSSTPPTWSWEKGACSVPLPP